MVNMMRAPLPLSAALIATLSLQAHAFADSSAPGNWIGRYSVSAPGPTDAQRDPLAVVTTIRFPSTIHTIGDAIGHLLMPSGFQLAPDRSVDLQVFLDLPLPLIHRNLGPITIDQALGTLVGFPWTLVVDPLHRQVAYELSSGYLSAQRGLPEAVLSAVSLPPSADAPVVLAAASVPDISPASPASGPDSMSDAGTGAQSFFEGNQTPIRATDSPTPRLAAQLSDRISPDLRGLQLQAAIQAILPGWRIDLFLDDPSRVESTVDLNGENTTPEAVLEKLADRFGLQLYPYEDRVPPILVVTDEQP